MIAVNFVNPHDPSGTVNDTATLDGFTRTAAVRTLVVVDEAYLEDDHLAARSAVRHVCEGAKVPGSRTLAKICGLAKLSIGYALAPTVLAGELGKTGIGSPHSFNRLSLSQFAQRCPIRRRRQAFAGSQDHHRRARPGPCSAQPASVTANQQPRQHRLLLPAGHSCPGATPAGRWHGHRPPVQTPSWLDPDHDRTPTQNVAVLRRILRKRS